MESNFKKVDDMSVRPVKVYLCGPINGMEDYQCRTWREQATRMLTFCSVIDPMRRDYRANAAEHAREIVRLDKQDIRACDLLLYYCDRKSFGSPMELLYAYDLGKSTITITTEFADQPWIIANSMAICSTLEDAAKVIQNWYRGGIYT